MSEVDTTPNRVMSRVDGQRIFEALKDAYDTDEGRYIQDYSDEKIAADLEVMWGWVKQVRERFFGESGANEAMWAGSEISDIQGYLTAIDGHLERMDKVHEKVAAEIAKMVEIREGLVARLRTLKPLTGKGSR